MKNKKGFTLIELLIVIGIIAILAIIIFVMLDPLTRFEQARDANRWSDVTAVLDAAKYRQVDNNGNFPTSIGSLLVDTYYMIGTCSVGGDIGCTAHTTSPSCADIEDLIDAKYLPKVPVDPSSGDSTVTDYYIKRDVSGALTVGACNPEQADEIEVTR